MEGRTVNVDAEKVIEQLLQRITNLELENAKLTVALNSTATEEIDKEGE